MTKSPKNHPSYGMLSLSRVSSSKEVHLFGSPVKHRHFIMLRLKKAKLDDMGVLMHRAPFSTETVAEAAMSPAQFAELCSSFNSGDGIPVTFTQVDGELIEDCPASSARAEVLAAFEDEMAQLADKLDDLEAQAQAIVLGKKMLSADRKKISGLISTLTARIRRGLPYIQETYSEHLDKLVQAAQGEIGDFFNRQVASHGCDALSDSIAAELHDALSLASEKDE